MDRYKALLAVALAWSILVTVYAGFLSVETAQLRRSVEELKSALWNATEALRGVRRGIESLGNMTGDVEVEVRVEGPVGRRVRVTLWPGATVLDALGQVVDVTLRNGSVAAINGVEGPWRVYVVRGGERIPVARPGSFRLMDGDGVVACRGC